MRVVDTALLAMLETTGVPIFDGLVTVDNSGRTVEYELPYISFISSIGDYHAPRLTGQYGRLSVYFSLMYVGLTREQAKGAGEKARAVLCGKRVSGAGITRSWQIGLDESQRVRRDDDAIREDGTPLFYGVDLYSVSVTLNSEGVPA